MKTALLVVLLAFPAAAQDVPAPVEEKPFAAFCLEPDERVLLAKRDVAAQVRIKELEKAVDQRVHWVVPVIVGVVALGVGAGVGYGISRAK